MIMMMAKVSNVIIVRLLKRLVTFWKTSVRLVRDFNVLLEDHEYSRGYK